MSAPQKKADRPFVVMVKPVGSACNMRCSYCYYLNAPASSPVGKMSAETLECLIRDYIQAAPGPVVSFTWHGGEPALAGLDFYRQAVALQQKYLPEGWECWNSLQTNGLLLDDEWCDFLAEAHFDVGLSLDGTPSLHDAFRPDAGGRATYERAHAAVCRLQARGIQPDLLCTVTSETARRGAEVYRALRDLGTGWMQFIPIVVRTEEGVTPDSVTPELYGDFLREVFCQWVFHDMGQTEVQLFSETALALSGREPNLCWLRKSCGHVPVVEKDGGVYACDHFVRPEYRVGAIQQEGLAAIVDGEKMTTFGAAKNAELTAHCRACPWLNLCGGACPKDRFALSPEGEPGQYYLCAGLEKYFSYAVPLLKEAMRLSAQGKPPREIMAALVQQERARFRGVSRNDPCPCGSGKKFKSCCLRLCP